MAAAGWLIVVCRGASIVLGVTALVLALKADDANPTTHRITFRDAHQRLWLMLIYVTVPFGVFLLMAESCLVDLELHHHHQEQEPPSDVKVIIALIPAEWLLAFITMGMAIPALLIDLAATPEYGAVYHLAADVTACAAGALAAASAFGLLWLLGTRFRQAQAAQA